MTQAQVELAVRDRVESLLMQGRTVEQAQSMAEIEYGCRRQLQTLGSY